MPKYTLPELPYAYSALEPHYSAEVLELHHGKHHAAYVSGANATLEKLEEEPSCGERMPMGRAPLGPTEQVCLEQYLEALIGAPSGEGASDAGVGGDAGGNQ